MHRSKLIASLCSFTVLAIGFGSVLADTAARAQEGPSYYLAGQVHPRFQLTISINGETVKTIKPKPNRAKIFLKQIDAELLRPGENSFAVRYEVNPEVADDVTPMPSFIVKVQSQSDPTDSSTKAVLAEVRGPDRPFPSDGGKIVNATFEVAE